MDENEGFRLLEGYFSSTGAEIEALHAHLVNPKMHSISSGPEEKAATFSQNRQVRQNLRQASALLWAIVEVCDAATMCLECTEAPACRITPLHKFPWA